MTSPCTVSCAGETTNRPPTSVSVRPAAHHAEAHDVLARVEELAQRGGAQGGAAAAAHRRAQGGVAGDALDRRVADGAVGLLAVDAPGYAGERVGANAGSGRCGWVLVRCLHGGAARQRHGRNRQDGERDSWHGEQLRARALSAAFARRCDCVGRRALATPAARPPRKDRAAPALQPS